MRKRDRVPSDAEWWRRPPFTVLPSEVIAGRNAGPEPPRGWARHLQTLIEASRRSAEGPAWFTPVDAYFGSVETRTDPSRYFWDGMKRLGPRDRSHFYFQFTLAGFGHYEPYGKPPQRILPGMGFFTVVPSRHRYYLPEDSPGWTFGWLGIYHPYFLSRVTKQIASTGPVVHAAPSSPLIRRAVRLVRGAFEKDFRDRLEVESELFALTLAFERLAEKVRNPQVEPLLTAVRQRVLADPATAHPVDSLARAYGQSRSAFSHFFRERTGQSPANYVTEVRVEQAARLLTTTRLPLETIAHECGFANANHFGKVFRRFRHQSPSAFRHLVR